jgi:hypothetical protein
MEVATLNAGRPALSGQTPLQAYREAAGFPAWLTNAFVMSAYMMAMFPSALSRSLRLCVGRDNDDDTEHGSIAHAAARTAEISTPVLWTSMSNVLYMLNARTDHRLVVDAAVRAAGTASPASGGKTVGDIVVVRAELIRPTDHARHSRDDDGRDSDSSDEDDGDDDVVNVYEEDEEEGGVGGGKGKRVSYGFLGVFTGYGSGRGGGGGGAMRVLALPPDSMASVPVLLDKQLARFVATFADESADSEVYPSSGAGLLNILKLYLAIRLPLPLKDRLPYVAASLPRLSAPREADARAAEGHGGATSDLTHRGSPFAHCYAMTMRTREAVGRFVRAQERNGAPAMPRHFMGAVLAACMGTLRRDTLLRLAGMRNTGAQ